MYITLWYYFTFQMQLSQEDLVLQERLNKLTEGIDLLINSHFRKCHPPLPNPTRSVSSGTPRKPGKVVHWKDIDTNDKAAATLTNTSNSESDHNVLSASCPMPLPRVRVCNSNSEIDILLNDEQETSMKGVDTSNSVTHKVLKLHELRSCSSTSSPPPICTIVIQEPNGQIRCPTPSSIADDEVFVS